MKITLRTKSGKEIETTLDEIKTAEIARNNSHDDLYCDGDPAVEIWEGELVFREPAKWETIRYDIGGNLEIAIQSIADFARDFLEEQDFWRLRHDPMRGFANEFANTLFLDPDDDDESCGELVDNLDEAAKLIALSIKSRNATTEVVD